MRTSALEFSKSVFGFVLLGNIGGQAANPDSDPPINEGQEPTGKFIRVQYLVRCHVISDSKVEKDPLDCVRLICI